jgi:tetratricopeptide (TPR) repeat protein
MILYPYIRGGEGGSPTGLEISEYAAALTFMGAWQEALGLLNKVKSKDVPQGLLYRAFALFARWDYARAIEPLELFINEKEISDYDKLVGKLNLGTAYLSQGNCQQADILLKEVYELSKLRNYKLLASNALERLAESAIQLKHFRRADELLYEAEANLQGSSSTAMLFIKKWRVFLNIQSEGVLEHHEKKLREIKVKAVELEHWQTVRDCDGFEATYKKDKKLLTHLLFGTPHEHFKEKLLKEFKTPFKIPESYLWGSDTTQIDSSAMTLDLKTGKLEFRNSEGSVVLKGEGLLGGSQAHKVLTILSKDFYSPCNYRTLFADLFPGQAYQPQISDEKVLGSVNELREWILMNQLPMEISELQGFFWGAFFRSYVDKSL